MNWQWESILISGLHTKFFLDRASFPHSSQYITFTVVFCREFVTKSVLIKPQCFYFCWAMCSHVKDYSLPAILHTMPPQQVGWKCWNCQGTQPGQLTQTDQYHVTSIPHGIMLSSRTQRKEYGRMVATFDFPSNCHICWGPANTGSVSACQHKALNICLCLYAQPYLTYFTVVILIPEFSYFCPSDSFTFIPLTGREVVASPKT